MDFHGNINLKDNEMQKLIFQQETDFPVDAVTGSVVFKGNVLYMSVAVGNDSQPVWIPLTTSIDTYVHTQSSTATTWTISHALGDKFPMVQVYDDNHEMIIPDSIVPDNTTTLAITFNTAVSGVAVVMHGDEIPANGIGIIEPSLAWFPIASNLTYDNKSYHTGTSGSFTVSPAGLRFNPDGTKMFVVGFTNDDVSQYSLSVAFDISTASYDNIQFSFTTQDNAPNGIAFNNDGTKMYMVGNNTGGIYQYSLPTPYILTGMSYDNVNRSITGIQVNSATGITLNNDGTKIYRIVSARKIENYNLSIAFDLSTAVWDTVQHELGVEIVNNLTKELLFNSDGTKMYILGPAHVYQYTLTIAFDISTFVYDNILYNITEDAICDGFVFSSTGDKLFIAGRGGRSIFQYSTNI